MDLESRTHRKRSVGRWRKQVGDLAFQAGLAAEALEHYQIASDILRPVNDWLWLAGTFEGLCAASVTLLFPHLRRPAVIQRIGSLTGESFTARNRYHIFINLNVTKISKTYVIHLVGRIRLGLELCALFHRI